MVHTLTSALLLPMVVFLLEGCGKADPPATTAPSNPPGTISTIVRLPGGTPARKIEVRLLAEPKAGLIIPGGEGGLAMVTAENIRPSAEGAEMLLIQRTETDDFGKFTLQAIPPGKYLLSVGTFSVGIWREWIDVEPGKTTTPEIKLVPP
ncbi:MAG: hypothetical protein RMJ35_03260 [Phycisphaerales bacterium]|nr:hypothetical protein [Phycisphaerales bacterium]